METRYSEVFQALTCKELAQAYGFLATVLSSPPNSDHMRTLCQLAQALNVACPGGWSLTELEREYMELWVVPNPRYAAPYESVYRDRWEIPCAGKAGSSASATVERLLMGESTVAMRQCFLAAGVLPVEGFPDHISNELRLLSYLWMGETHEEPAQTQKRTELRLQLCRNHLRPWIGLLRKKVAESERLGFYSLALEITETLLHEEESYEAE